MHLVLHVLGVVQVPIELLLGALVGQRGATGNDFLRKTKNEMSTCPRELQRQPI